MSPQSNQTTSPDPVQTASDVKWYALSPVEIASLLQVDPAKGLSAAEAQQRLQQ
jgi:Ca2+-transporting ATPase